MTTLEALRASVFMGELEARLKASRTVAELEAAARQMDTPAFDALPEAERVDLGALYSWRLLLITGAFS